MMLSKKWLWILSIGLGGTLLATGCSSTPARHRWLTFFFDGVPDPQAVSRTMQPELPRNPSTNATPALALALAEPPMVVHAPYADRKCMECHASNYSQRLKGEISTTCAACHKQFLVKARFTHAPLEDGQCTLCHNPHQAKEKFLLVKNSRELCFDCHEPEEVLKIKACGQASESSCTVCHNPHQENQKFLLHSLAAKSSPARDASPDP